MIRKLTLTATVLALVATLATGVSAQTTFNFVLNGGQELPANASTAVGNGFATLDGANNFTLVVYHNVAGATAAHIHNAPVGVNGGVLFGLGTPTSPIVFSTTLSAGDVTNLNSGNFYVNVHSGAFPGGEIRGQIVGGFQEQVFINEYCNDPFGAVVGLDTNGDGVVATSGAQSDDEFVEIVNGTAQLVNIGGWTVSDAIGVRHTFAAGTMMPPGSAIVVFGGGSVAAFNASGRAGVVADTGLLGLNNSGDSVTIADSMGTIIDTHSWTSGGSDDGDGEAIARSPETPNGTFVMHTTLPSGASHSAGFYADNVHPYPAAILPAPVTAAYPGNGTDAAIEIGINGSVDPQASNVHTATGGDLLSISFASPGGTLTGVPFLGLAQIFTTGSPATPLQLPGDAQATVVLDLAGPITVLADGLSAPGGLFTPVLAGYTVSGFLPAGLAGSGLSVMVLCLNSDPGLNAVNLGNAEAHEIVVN